MDLPLIAMPFEVLDRASTQERVAIVGLYLSAHKAQWDWFDPMTVLGVSGPTLRDALDILEEFGCVEVSRNQHGKRVVRLKALDTNQPG
jgi:hypothetical protein